MSDSSLLSDPPSSDSELSELSRSPTPPSDLRNHGYPSPPSSSDSSAKTSPAPELMDATITVRTLDGSPPRKRRRISSPKPRATERLDLRNLDNLLECKPQLDKLMKVLHKKRKIVVIAGAGISVSAGIPDFRSATGLFKSLRKEHKLKSSGKDLFDASVYKDDTSTATFHTMVRELSIQTQNAEPTPFHHLLATLADEGRLLRLYSQNVDSLDTRLPPLSTSVPLDKPWPRTIQLHGGLDKMVCSKCRTVSDLEAELFKEDTPPPCNFCLAVDNARTTHAGKRSHGIGKLRPRMVLYNEDHPDADTIGSVTNADLRTRPDALIVVGTTLKVPGVRRIAREMCKVVRDRKGGVTIWMNNDPEPCGKDFEWDLVVRGPCDTVAKLAAMRKWDDAKEDFDGPFLEVADEEAQKRVMAGLDKVEILQTGLETPEVSRVYRPSTEPEKLEIFGAPDPRTPRKQFPGEIVRPPISPITPQPTPPHSIKGTLKVSKLILNKSSVEKPIKKEPAIFVAGSTVISAVRPKKQQKAKPVPRKKKAVIVQGKITSTLTVSKAKTQAPKDKFQDPENVNITVGRVKPADSTAGEKENQTLHQPMAPVTPGALCINASPPYQLRGKHGLGTDIEEKDHVPQPLGAGKRNGETISPNGPIPRGMGHIIDV